VTKDLANLHNPAPVPLTLIGVWMVLYRKATGEITQVMMQSPVTAGLLATPEIGLCEIPGAIPSLSTLLLFPTTHYVDASAYFPQIRERAVCPAMLDGITLRSLPLPCQIQITKPLGGLETYDEAEASDVDLSFDHPGTYTVRVLSARHLPGTFTVTV
jgi:hypothetical protein